MKGILRRKRKTISNHRISLFWKSFLMMLCVQLVSLAALLVSNHMQSKKQTEFYLETVQAQVTHNCESFSQELYKNYAIPQAITDTRYYSYISAENSGSLPEKYVSVLPLLRTALNNQVFLYGDNEECILYFSGADCIVTRKKCFSEAEACLEEYLGFSDMSAQTLLELLQRKSYVRILPVQEVMVGEKSVRCMPLIIRPANSKITVLSLYGEETVLSQLGLEALPEGTVCQIRSDCGEVLYSGEKEVDNKEEFYEISSRLDELGAVVTFHIPKQCLQDIGRNARRIGICLIGIDILLGFLLSLLLAEVFTTPMRKLLQNHLERPESGIISEVQYLADIIADAQTNAQELREVIRQAYLAQKKEAERNEAADVISFIRENYMQEWICAAYVAEQFGLSEKSVYALVRKETGASFGEYLLRLRMQRASAPLCTTITEIKKIGEMCGYFSESTFYRVFKKYYQKTPSQYRKETVESDISTK